jgi:hypothetical protein
MLELLYEQYTELKMEYPLTSNDNHQSTHESQTESRESGYKKHNLGELIYSLEKNIRESRELLDKIKDIYYHL